MNLISTRRLTGRIRVETGLHIGSGREAFEIGGIEGPVARHPLTRDPYLPGSSLKGKMRALMEWKLGIVGQNGGKVCECGKCDVCRVFGAAMSGKDSGAKSPASGPTRLLVRDAFVSPECKKRFVADDLPMFEEKRETSLNRITAAASPRSFERVVPGVEFSFELVYRIIDSGDGGKRDEANWEKVVLTALALMRSDSLGGGGSRGSGKVEFLELRDEKGAEVGLPAV
jgi:CRISPR-associated protein Csm3